MKVKFLNSCSSQNQDLIVGKEYLVLSIEFYNKDSSLFSKFYNDYVVYRIECEDGTLRPHPANDFQITSGNLSECWIANYNDNVSFSILPKEWAYSNFWEDLYNGEINALRNFKDAKKKIYLEELSFTELKEKILDSTTRDSQFYLEALIEGEYLETEELVYKLATDKKFQLLWPICFKYLSRFKNSQVEELFINYLVHVEEPLVDISDTIKGYFEM